MWLLKASGRKKLAALTVICATATLSACSFTPLYGENGPSNVQLELRYADPNNRFDRIIMQEFALSFGKSRLIDAAEVTVSSSTSSRRIGRTSSGSPATTYEASVTANVSVMSVDAEKPVFTASRTASASYTTNGQRLADVSAAEEAADRAAKAVAQTLKLLMAAELPGKL